MAGFIRVPADDAGKRVDTVTLTDELVEVHRQKMVVTGGSGTAEVVVVTNAAPAAADMGLVVRQAGTLTAVVSGTVNVNGGVAISGTAIVAGSVVISGTATVAGNVNVSTMPAVTLAADQILGSISRTVQVAVGTPFTLNNISATTIVAGNVNISTMPAVSLAAGAILDSISATVGVKGQVSLAASTNNIGFINNISATVIVAGVVSLGAGTNNIGFINNISATVTVAGNINISATPSVILAAGTAVFGTLNDISRTVQVAVGTPFTIQGISTTVTTVVRGYTPAVMAASHGPKCVSVSTSANVTLIASPGAGANIYVTQLMVGNFSGTLTRARVGTSASISTVVYPMAASGGGFVLNFDPPWMLSASEACLCSIKPNASEAYFTVHFFVI